MVWESQNFTINPLLYGEEGLVMYYKNYIKSRGTCPKTNRKQYLTKQEAQMVANGYPNEGYSVIRCEDCGFYHLVRKKSSSDVPIEKNEELNSFYEPEPKLDVETATKFLEENGYAVCEEDYWNKIISIVNKYERVYRITNGEE